MFKSDRLQSVLYFISGLLLTVNLYGQQGSEVIDSIDSDLRDNRYITVTGVGDIMLGTAFPSDKYLPPGDDPVPLMESLFGVLNDSEITFGNLEGPFVNNAKLAKKCRDTTICYAFRTPEHYSTVIQQAGFDIISLANNHIGDFGSQGRETTIRLLDSLGIYHAGTDEFPYAIFSRDSVSYGFCALSPNKGTISITDTLEAGKIVSFLDKKCDIVIVSFHGGAEGSDYQRVLREDEEYYGENRGNVYAFAHKMIDKGADIIFGHGPHVSRAVEVYKNRFIAYSLGNFCTYRRFNLAGPNGYAPVIKVRTDTNGYFIDGEIIPVYQDQQNGHVKKDPSGRVIRKIQELVRLDFPDPIVYISDEGMITYK